MSVNLTAIIKSLAGKSEEMKAVLLELATKSIQDEGCIQYDLHQPINDPNIFIFHEIWQNAEKLEEHNKTPHILKFKADAESLFAENPAIYISNKIK